MNTRAHGLCVLFLCTLPTLTLASPEWVTIPISTESIASGNVGIAKDGITIAWTELGTSGIQVKKRDLIGQTTVVREFPGNFDDVGGPIAHIVVAPSGNVISSQQVAPSNLWHKFVDDVLVHTDAEANILLGTYNDGFVDNKQTGNGFGDLFFYDIPGTFATIDSFSDTYTNVKPLAINPAHTAAVHAIGINAADSGIYTWASPIGLGAGSLNPVPLEGLPSQYTANKEAIIADISDSTIAYAYRAVPDNGGDAVRVLVLRNLTTAISSSTVLDDVATGKTIQVDALGRAIYTKKVFDAARNLFVVSLYVFDGVEERKIASELDEDASKQLSMNYAGQVAYVRYPDSCGVIDPDVPTCKSDVFFYDLNTSEDVQVTNHPLGTFVWSAQISEEPNIVFMTAEQPKPVGADSTQTIWASLIDQDAPTTPTGVMVQPVSPTEMDLSWDPATDTIGLSEYEVFRDGIFIATSDTADYQDSGLTESTSYAYSIVAVDLAGNRSSPSAPVSAMTLAPPPPPPPASSGGGGGSIGIGFLALMFLLVLIIGHLRINYRALLPESNHSG